MLWQPSHKFDPDVLPLANRHYNRQTPGSKQFAPPGRTVVLKILSGEPLSAAAYWISLHQRYVQHDFGDAWVCSAFRRELDVGAKSSELIRQAVAVTRHRWGAPPAGGMLTFVDESQVRRKRDPGRCFRRAGFEPIGRTRRRKHLVLRLPSAAMPAPQPAQMPVPPLFNVR